MEDSTCNAQGKPVHELCYAAEVVSALRNVPEEPKPTRHTPTLLDRLSTWLPHLKNVA